MLRLRLLAPPPPPVALLARWPVPDPSWRNAALVYTPTNLVPSPADAWRAAPLSSPTEEATAAAVDCPNRELLVDWDAGLNWKSVGRLTPWAPPLKRGSDVSGARVARTGG